MNRLCKMTVEELAALDLAKEEELVAFEAMHRGVPVPILEDVPAEVEVPEPHQIGFQVRDIDAVFESKEGAENLAAVLAQCGAYKIEDDWRTSSKRPGKKYADDKGALLIDVVMGYTEDEWIALKGKIKEKERVKKEIERIRNANKNAMEAYDAIVREVSYAQCEAQQRVWRRAQLAERFASYIRMADGNIGVAANFFEQSYAADDEEDRDAVLKEHSPRWKAEAGA